MRRARFIVLLLFGSLFAASAVFGFPWNTDMFDSLALKAYRAMMRVPPEGTLPVKGGALPATRDETAEIQQNPIPFTPESVEKGRKLFSIYCTACHGVKADGHGPVAPKLKLPPFALTAFTRGERSDGYFFGTIRYGGTVMPAFKASMSPEESWEIVNYLKSLQKPE